MWTNGRMTERKQDDGIGKISVDWEVDNVVIYTHSELTSASDKVNFKARAIAKKNAFIARQAKQANIGEKITTYMNS